jgi:hypothetical protein
LAESRKKSGANIYTRCTIRFLFKTGTRPDWAGLIFTFDRLQPLTSEAHVVNATPQTCLRHTLMGIVVNNAIVLIDTIDSNLESGMGSSDAVANAVSRRTRSILLTTLTTIAGLLPLTLANSTLWPPMACAWGGPRSEPLVA